MDCQDTLGTLAILNGHLHIEWTMAIANTYTRRISPPGKDSNKAPKDKTLLELTLVLLTTVCDLFETIWATRNSVLHDNGPSTDNSHGSQLNERLLQYKRKRLL